MGLINMILGCIFASLWCLSKEMVLRKLEINHNLCIGIEGMWGTIIYLTILIPLASFINDP